MHLAVACIGFLITRTCIGVTSSKPHSKPLIKHGFPPGQASSRRLSNLEICLREDKWCFYRRPLLFFFAIFYNNYKDMCTMKLNCSLFEKFMKKNKCIHTNDRLVI